MVTIDSLQEVTSTSTLSDSTINDHLRLTVQPQYIRYRRRQTTTVDNRAKDAYSTAVVRQ